MLHGGAGHIPEGTVWGACTGAGTSLKRLWPMEESTLEQKKLRRKGKWNKKKDKARRNSYTLAPGACFICCLSVRNECKLQWKERNWEAGRSGVCTKVEAAIGREKVSFLSVQMFVIFVSQTSKQQLNALDEIHRLSLL